jgi:tripeptidyl-peptidase I
VQAGLSDLETMRLVPITTALAALVAVASSNPFQRSVKHVIHEEQPIAKRNWYKSSLLHKAAKLPVRIGLTQQNLHLAEEFIYEVSHPDSSSYGKHWSSKKIIETFAPKQESIDAVTDWLEAEGIARSRVHLSKSRNWLSFNSTTREVERLLKAEYHVYRHNGTGHYHVACEKYHIPEHLSDHIDIITPTVHFDQRLGQGRKNKMVQLEEEQATELKKRALESRQLRAETGAKTGILGDPNSGSLPKQGAQIDNALMNLDQCDRMITPACLRALYATPPGTLRAGNNTLGIVEYTPQAFLQNDLNLFFKEFEPRLDRVSPIVNFIDGAILQTKNQSFSFNGESALDLEFAMALIYPQQATLYQVGDTIQGASFNNFLDSIDASFCTFDGGDSKDPNVDGQYLQSTACGVAPLTNVISTSYGYNEADLSARYEKRQCNEYMKLGLQGVTIVYSSGDAGVGGNGDQCIDTLTGAYNNGTSGIFNPSFPGSCPYVLSVGATQILNGSTVHTPESACQRVILSGGGFSNVFALPDYQKDAMNVYFRDHPPPYGAERYNNSRTVRGFPDVSANGANYVTAVNGNFSLSFGTSASAPVFASILNLINEKRIDAGKGPVGFVNPVLYAHPEVLNDITNGRNPGCGTQGFEAVKGWDPVTGLG